MWERIGECVREIKLGTTHTRCVPLSQSAATAVRGHEEQGPVASAQPGREQASRAKIVASAALAAVAGVT